MGKIDYRYLAKRDLREAKGVLTLGYYSTAGRLSQQCIEKILKDYIEKNGNIEDKSFLNSHKLRHLYNKVCDMGGLVFDKSTRD